MTEDDETTADSADSKHDQKRVRIRKRADEIKDFRCKHLIAVIENPIDDKNIGTIIRNANALGVEKVYVVDERGRLPNDWEEIQDRKAIAASSVSAVKWTFVKRFDSTKECLDHLQSKNFVSVATSPHVKGKDNYYLHEADFTNPSKLAIWFGNESRGISDEAVERSAFCVAIPMFGIIESFNLATSSGIVLYEATKQRRAYQSQYRLRNKRGKRANPLPVVLKREGEE